MHDTNGEQRSQSEPHDPSRHVDSAYEAGKSIGVIAGLVVAVYYSYLRANNIFSAGIGRGLLLLLFYGVACLLSAWGSSKVLGILFAAPVFVAALFRRSSSGKAVQSAPAVRPRSTTNAASKLEGITVLLFIAVGIFGAISLMNTLSDPIALSLKEWATGVVGAGHDWATGSFARLITLGISLGALILGGIAAMLLGAFMPRPRSIVARYRVLLLIELALAGTLVYRVATDANALAARIALFALLIAHMPPLLELDRERRPQDRAIDRVQDRAPPESKRTGDTPTTLDPVGAAEESVEESDVQTEETVQGKHNE